MATLTAYVFGTKYAVDNRSSVLTTTRDLLHRLKMWWTLVHKRLKTRPAFYSPSVNSAFCFIARLCRRDQQTELNQILPNGGRQIAIRICCRAVGVIHPEKNGCQETFTFVRFFDDFDTLMANIFWTKRDIDYPTRVLECAKGLLHCPKISWTNGLKRDWTFTHLHYFVLSLSIAHPVLDINVATTATLDETALDFSEAQIWSPKRC